MALTFASTYAGIVDAFMGSFSTGLPVWTGGILCAVIFVYMGERFGAPLPVSIASFMVFAFLAAQALVLPGFILAVVEMVAALALATVVVLRL
jgi:hypothetical protein